MRRRAFTLVELLIVLGDHRVLLALIVPTLAAAREVAKTTQFRATFANRHLCRRLLRRQRRLLPRRPVHRRYGLVPLGLRRLPRPGHG